MTEDTSHEFYRSHEDGAPGETAMTASLASCASPQVKKDIHRRNMVVIADKVNNHGKVKKKQLLCQECQNNSFQYVCPRCRYRTCSLQCCLSHKRRLNCTGKRDATAYLSVHQMNDNTVASDYHFLESVLGTVNASRRLIYEVTATSSPADKASHSNDRRSQNKRQRTKQQEEDENNHDSPIVQTELHPLLQQQEFELMKTNKDLMKGTNNEKDLRFRCRHPKWRKLQQIVSRTRNINLLLMPVGMERHQLNHSHVRKDSIVYWTVEWKLHNRGSCKEGENSFGYDTTSTIIKALCETEMIWDVAINQVLAMKQSKDEDVLLQDHFSLLMKILPSPSNQARYIEIEKTQSLREVLQNKTVIEFPIIEIVPKDCLHLFPRLVQESLSAFIDEKDPNTNETIQDVVDSPPRIAGNVVVVDSIDYVSQN